MPKSGSLLETIKTHFIRYPELQVDDLYKLIFQAAMGNEHAIHDLNSARSYLLREIEQLCGTSTDPLIDPLSPDRLLARIHLRPFLQAKGDLEKLLKAFVDSSTIFPADKSRLEIYQRLTIEYIFHTETPLQAESVEEFFQQKCQQGYPPVHHSPAYVRLYAPSYRVIHLDTYPGLFDLA